MTVELAPRPTALAVPSFGLPAYNSDGVDATTSSRPTITATASATPHTKGAWQQVVAATSAAVSWIDLLLVVDTGVNGADTSTLLDVGIGAPGSEVVIVPNVGVGFGQGPRSRWTFPVRIPAGTRVAIRAQSVVASKTVGLVVLLGAFPTAITAPDHITAMGVDLANSRGVTLAAPGGPNAPGAWTEISAATPEAIGALVLGVQGAGVSTISTGGAVLVDVGVGTAGAEVPVLSSFYATVANTETVQIPFQPNLYPVAVPAGSRLSARYQRAVSSLPLDVILYGAPAA